LETTRVTDFESMQDVFEGLPSLRDSQLLWQLYCISILGLSISGRFPLSMAKESHTHRIILEAVAKSFIHVPPLREKPTTGIAIGEVVCPSKT